jgi:hypothetical protein
VKSRKASPKALVDGFDFTCCKFALWVTIGVPVLCEYHDANAIPEVKDKKLSFCGTDNPSSVLAHISKLHRKGYIIDEKTLFAILEMHEKGTGVRYEHTKDE